MIFEETPVHGAFLVDPEPLEDERGLFARTFCVREFGARGLETRWVQCSVSFNRRKGTVRGMHYQAAPHGEAKLVRCTRGSVYDVIIDLRRESASFKRWFGVELTESNRRMLYVPVGCAHGFQTLEAGAEVLYQISECHRPECARGVRWNDPAFGVQWPLPCAVISERDGHYGDFTAEAPDGERQGKDQQDG